MGPEKWCSELFTGVQMEKKQVNQSIILKKMYQRAVFRRPITATGRDVEAKIC